MSALLHTAGGTAPQARGGGDAVVRLRHLPDREWLGNAGTCGIEAALEAGEVLVLPQLSFALSDAESRFRDERWADGQAKNISVRWPAGQLRGVREDVGATDRAALRALIVRYAEHSEALALRLFPHYRSHLRRGNTSLRPTQIAGRRSSWRKDDTRLHVDAFPSNPMHGVRLLRVFCNIHPQGEPREWRVGEPFEAHARRFLGQIAAPWPGSAALLRALRITKRRRSPYDHWMLRLHDLAKSDAAFQRASPQAALSFAPGTTWVVFSDQVPHAAMSGQHMLEQTFLLDVDHMQTPAASPLHTLERLTGRQLR